MAKFSTGDKVLVVKHIGGERDGFSWVCDMDKALGKLGTVIEVSTQHETGPRYRLQFDDPVPSRYWYKEGSLFEVDDTVIRSHDTTVTPSHVDTAVPTQTKSITGRQLLRDEFAIHAPPVPTWYPRKVLNRTNDQMFYEKEEDRFFRWAYYYADKMMEARGV